ncbi:MAG TPA: cytochrome c [Candidatus Elarobacter sp.]|nr:cytochrome c [Candidatus Elarobacter sp.]
MVSRRTTRLLAAGVLAAAVALWLGRARRAPVPATDLSADEEAAWSRTVAALQQVAEEYPETLELKDPDASRRRRAQLAGFLGETSRLLARTSSAPELPRQVEALGKRVLGTDYRVGTDSRALIDRIVERAQLRRTPRLKPDLANGRRVLAEACAPCHGSDGSDAPPAITAALDPPPPNILHPPHNLTPYEMFNRVTYGGVGTAMPSFEQGLTEAERWDVVFYLFAERWWPCEKPLPPIGADELALMGDFELGNKFGYGAAACLRRDFLPPR